MKHFTLISCIFAVLFNSGSCQYRADLVSQIGDLGDRNFDNGEVDMKIQVIFPGTKWCGDGNKAANYDDLGRFKKVDACCRDHDHCDDIIPAGGTKHGLTNTAKYTRLNCECDDKFYHCLKDANTNTSKMVGKTYFDILGTKCYSFDHPITGCKRKAGIIKKTCVEYTYDTSQPKIYQWKDVLDF